MVSRLVQEYGSYVTDLVFEPMESRIQVRQSKKKLTYVYMFNLKVFDLIEHIS